MIFVLIYGRCTNSECSKPLRLLSGAIRLVASTKTEHWAKLNDTTMITESRRLKGFYTERKSVL